MLNNWELETKSKKIKKTYKNATKGQEFSSETQVHAW